jgi:nucleoside-diphosphate-sugar epimerase
MNKLLLTGASGFIGRNIMDEAASYHFEVVAVTSACDLLDAREVARLIARERPTHLIHCAWYVNPADYINSAANYAWRDAGVRLFNEFYGCGGVRAAFLGTCFEYAASQTPLAEDAPLDPIGVYGQCKAELGERLNRQAIAERLGFVWCRLFYLFGKYERAERFIPRAIREVRAGEPIDCATGRLVRDYMYAADAARAILHTARGAHQGFVNICSGVGLSTREIYDAVAGLCGVPSPVTYQDADDSAKGRSVIVGNPTALQKSGFAPKYGVNAGLAEVIP